MAERVVVSEDRDAGGEIAVEQQRCGGGGQRGGGRGVEFRHEAEWRQVGDEQLCGSGLNEALEIEDLLEGCVGYLLRGGGVEQVDGAAPDDKESVVVDVGMGGEIVGDLLADIFDRDGVGRVEGNPGKVSVAGAVAGGGVAVCVVGAAVERVDDFGEWLGRAAANCSTQTPK